VGQQLVLLVVSSDLGFKTILHSELDLSPPTTLDKMVATRAGDEDAEGMLCVGAPAVTTELLLHSVNVLKLRIPLPRDTPRDVETMSDGNRLAASVPVNIWRLMYIYPPT
jgi:hypothetical protein